MDPKDLVERGYDRIGAEYERWSEEATDFAREYYLRVLLDSLSEGASVLDLGCGSGELLTRWLAERFQVTGVDLSTGMVELARCNVPNAKFIRGDMAAVEFAPESFDGVCAFYSLTHLRPDQLPALLHRVAGWLRPSGLFVASMSNEADPGSVQDDWVAGVSYVLRRLRRAEERGASRRGRAKCCQSTPGDHPREGRGRYLSVGCSEEAGLSAPVGLDLVSQNWRCQKLSF